MIRTLLVASLIAVANQVSIPAAHAGANRNTPCTSAKPVKWLVITAPPTVREISLGHRVQIPRCRLARFVAATIVSDARNYDGDLNKVHPEENGRGGFDAGVWRVKFLKYGEVGAAHGPMTVYFQDRKLDR